MGAHSATLPPNIIIELTPLTATCASALDLVTCALGPTAPRILKLQCHRTSRVRRAYFYALVWLLLCIFTHTKISGKLIFVFVRHGHGVSDTTRLAKKRSATDTRDLLRRDVEEAQRAQRPSQCNAESRRICCGPIATERRVGERGERIDCGAQNTTEQEEHSDQRA